MSFFPLANLTVPHALKSITNAPLPAHLTTKQIQDIRNFIEDYESSKLPENASGLEVWDLSAYRCVYAFKNKVHPGVCATFMNHDFSTSSAYIGESDDVIPGSGSAGYGPEYLLALLRLKFH